jgi:hypothetical protein
MTIPKLDKIFHRALFRLIDNLKQGGNGGKIELFLTPRDTPKKNNYKPQRIIKAGIRIVIDGKEEVLLNPKDVSWDNKGVRVTNKGVG